MGIEGALRLRVRWDGRRVHAVEISSTRAVAASRVLEGRTPREAATLAPMLFSLCGRAQGVATLRAWEGALGMAPEAGAARAREWAVAAEAVQENLWRLMLDWPEALGETPATEAFAAWRRRLTALTAKLMKADGWHEPGAAVVAAPEPELAAAGTELVQWLGSALLGTDASAWVSELSLEAWWNRGATPTARMLRRLFEGDGLAGRSAVPLMRPSPEGLERMLERTLREPEYPARPDWDGEPRETGALARMAAHPAVAVALEQHGNCVAVRVLARLVETAALASRLAEVAGAKLVAGRTLAAGTGAASVETSRGLLAHVVGLEGGRIGRYRILAPTEWNFHPDGPFAEGLAGTEAETEAGVHRALRLQALALDPCVAYEAVVAHA